MGKGKGRSGHYNNYHGNYRKMFAYVFHKDWVNDITPCGIEEKKMCYHKAEGSDKE